MQPKPWKAFYKNLVTMYSCAGLSVTFHLQNFHPQMQTAIIQHKFLVIKITEMKLKQMRKRIVKFLKPSTFRKNLKEFHYE
jgi:hypothetical protein